MNFQNEDFFLLIDGNKRLLKTNEISQYKDQKIAVFQHREHSSK